jgi:hypothetical protein
MYGRELEPLREICTDKMRFDIYLSDYRNAIYWAIGLALPLSLILLLNEMKFSRPKLNGLAPSVSVRTPVAVPVQPSVQVPCQS